MERWRYYLYFVKKTSFFFLLLFKLIFRLSGQSPFLGENIAHTYCNVERGNWEFCEEFNENCISAEAKDFISKLLVVDKKFKFNLKIYFYILYFYSKRMSAKECLQHQWVIDFLKKSQDTNNINNEKQLDIVKLRSYVRNKRFRVSNLKYKDRKVTPQ